MHATLSTGGVNRRLTRADLNIPDSDKGPSGLHATVPGAPRSTDAGAPANSASAPFLPSKASDAAGPAPVIAGTVASLPTAGTVPPVALLQTPILAPAVPLESGGGDNAAQSGVEAEPVPLPPAIDPDAPLPAVAARPAEGW